MIKRTHCPITKQPSNVIFARAYHLPELQDMLWHAPLQTLVKNEVFEIRHCPISNLFFQTTVLEEAELPLVYSWSKSQRNFQEDIASHKLYRFAHQTEEIQVLRQVCREKTPTVLDFGCNWGKWASMALAYGCNVFGVDVNPAAQVFCSQRGITMLTENTLPANTFDFINCDQIMEHVHDPLSLMRTLQHSLKKGGIIKVSTPHHDSLPNILKNGQQSNSNTCLNPTTIDALYPLVHINLFTRTSLNTLATLSNLVPFKIPFWTALGACQLWNIPRQFGRNLTTPFKRWRGTGTYAWYQKNM